MKRILLPSLLGLASLAATSHAATLSLDFQPTGGTTAAGFLAFEVTTGMIFPAAGTNYTEFGATINVRVSGANLENATTDSRAIARNGSAADVRNDWIGVDARNAAGGNPEALFTITVSGLPAGAYSWASLLHDGGTGTTGAGQGNISGNIRTTFIDASGTTLGTGMISSENPMLATSSFTRNFTSNGSPVALTLGTTGVAPDAIFALASNLVITSIPEPSTAFLGMVGLLGLLGRRRR